MARLVALIVTILLGQVASAGAAPSSAAASVTSLNDLWSNSAEMSAAIVTIGPGDEVWEKFGHNMLLIHNPQRGLDVAFNWGVFDFGPDFIPHFLQGKLIYWMEGYDAGPVIDGYRKADRSIWVQELNLTPAQCQQLWDLCVWNSRDENKSYRYDYFTDNCSTRVRDALDAGTGGQFKAVATKLPSNLTCRSETLRLTCSEWWLYVGLDFVLGHPVDRPMSAWEEMFIPMRMRDRLNQIQIADASGHQLPLVKREVTLYASTKPPLRETPPFAVPWFALAGLLIGAGATLLARCRGKWVCRWSFIGLAGAWLLLCSFGGLLLIYFWTLTDHSAVRPNENILQLPGPVNLALLVLIPFAIRPAWRRATKLALILASATLATCVIGLLLKPLPMMYQQNWNMIALALPANTGLAWAMWTLNRARLATVQNEPNESKLDQRAPKHTGKRA